MLQDICLVDGSCHPCAGRSGVASSVGERRIAPELVSNDLNQSRSRHKCGLELSN
jgi:hypothetical protein